MKGWILVIFEKEILGRSVWKSRILLYLEGHPSCSIIGLHVPALLENYYFSSLQGRSSWNVLKKATSFFLRYSVLKVACFANSSEESEIGRRVAAPFSLSRLPPYCSLGSRWSFVIGCSYVKHPVSHENLVMINNLIGGVCVDQNLRTQNPDGRQRIAILLLQIYDFFLLSRSPLLSKSHYHFSFKHQQATQQQ